MTSTTFVLANLPASILSLIFSFLFHHNHPDSASWHLFRAIANLLQVTRYVLNFIYEGTLFLIVISTTFTCTLSAHQSIERRFFVCYLARPNRNPPIVLTLIQLHPHTDVTLTKTFTSRSRHFHNILHLH